MKKIIVTGHEGWIGSMVVQSLLSYYSIEDLKLNVFDSGNVTYHAWKEQWHPFIAEVGVPDLIIHIGGNSDSSIDSISAFQSNFQPSVEIARFCSGYNVNMLYFSSAAAIEPVTAYGYSKLAAEEYIMCDNPESQFCIFRPYNVYGPLECQKTRPSIVYQVRTKTLPVIYKNCIRDFVHVYDVVCAVMQVVRKWKYGTFEIGTGNGTPIRHLPVIFGIEENQFNYDELCPPTITPIRVANKENLLPDWHPVTIEELYPGAS